MVRFTWAALTVASAVWLVVPPALAADNTELTDEPSRGDLARYAMLREGLRAIPRDFEFPEHAVSSRVFGIDVSHHQGKIDWHKVVGHGVRFVYVKATQGETSFDGQFANNWAALKDLGEGQQPIRRGAYHFMSATKDAAKQADHFLATLGKLDAKDLPPCLDVEWDFPRKEGRLIEDDQWKVLSATEIVARIKVWVDKVEQVTGKKPLIYTNAAWWKERIGRNLQLNGYKLWIADYGAKSLNLEEPRTPKDFTWVFWQMTDLGKIASAGLTKGLDVNVLSATDKELAALFLNTADVGKAQPNTGKTAKPTLRSAEN